MAHYSNQQGESKQLREQSPYRHKNLHFNYKLNLCMMSDGDKRYGEKARKKIRLN